MEIVEFEKVTHNRENRHRAFPSIVVKDGKTIQIAYREGSNHVSSLDGRIMLATSSTNDYNIEELVEEDKNNDLRINHGMTIMSTGDVWVPYFTLNTSHGRLTTNGYVLTGEGTIPINDPLHRLVPYGKILEVNNDILMPCYEACNRKGVFDYAAMLKLDKTRMEFVLDEIIACNHTANINETDIVQIKNNLLALSRNEDGLAVWSIKNITIENSRFIPVMMSRNIYIDSPAMIEYKGSIYFAGRTYNKWNNGKTIVTDKNRVSMFKLDDNEISEEMIIEPCHSWDCGYPSLAIKGNEILCAYYTEFGFGNSNIKIARIEP